MGKVYPLDKHFEDIPIEEYHYLGEIYDILLIVSIVLCLISILLTFRKIKLIKSKSCYS